MITHILSLILPLVIVIGVLRSLWRILRLLYLEVLLLFLILSKLVHLIMLDYVSQLTKVVAWKVSSIHNCRVLDILWVLLIGC